MSTWQEDFKFLLDQHEERIQHLGGIDSAAVARQKRQNVRLEKKNNQAAGANKKARLVTETKQKTIDESSDDSKEDEEFHLPPPNNSKEIQLTINTKTFVKQVSQTSLGQRSKVISHRDQTVLCAAFLKTSRGTVNDLAFSPVSTHRLNAKAQKDMADEVRESFSSKKYKFLSAH